MWARRLDQEDPHRRARTTLVVREGTIFGTVDLKRGRISLLLPSLVEGHTGVLRRKVLPTRSRLGSLVVRPSGPPVEGSSNVTAPP